MSRNPGPGPAKYMLPTTIGYSQHDPRKERKPMYSMRPLASSRYESIGPGPAKYALEKQTRTGAPRDLKYTMGLRPHPLKADLIPGPGAHNNHLVPTMKCKRAPEYTFGMRIDLPNKDTVPGPNRYDGVVHMVRPKAPCYTMRQQIKELGASQGPGPAQYSLPTRSVTHNRSPNYSIRLAHKPPVDRTPHPGPNRYGLMDLRMDTNAPSYTFGIRYPDWTVPMIVPGDNC